MRWMKAAALGMAILAGGSARAWLTTPMPDVGNGRSIAVFANGDLASTGLLYMLNQMAVVRLDAVTGEVLWRRDFSEPSDGTVRIAVDPADDLFVLSNGAWDVIKIDGATGDVLWIASPPGTVRALAVDAQGDVVVGGSDHDQEVVTKYSGATGAVLWTVTLDASSVYAVTIDPSGDPLVASNATDGHLTANVVLRRLSGADGHSLWDTSLPVTSSVIDTPVEIALDAAGRLVVLVNTFFPSPYGEEGPGDRNRWTVVSADASTGQTHWLTAIPLDAAGYDTPRGLALGTDGTVYAAGSLQDGRSSRRFAVVAIDGGTGSELWRQSLRAGSYRYSIATDVALAPDGSVVATGVARGPKNGYVIVTTSLRRDGRRNWETASSLSRDAVFAQADGLVVDPTGAVGVVGTLSIIPDAYGQTFPAVIKLAPNGTDFGGPALGITPKAVTREIKN